MSERMCVCSCVFACLFQMEPLYQCDIKRTLQYLICFSVSDGAAAAAAVTLSDKNTDLSNGNKGEGGGGQRGITVVACVRLKNVSACQAWRCSGLVVDFSTRARSTRIVASIFHEAPASYRAHLQL